MRTDLLSASQSICDRFFIHAWRRGLAVRLAGCFLLVFLATAFAGAISQGNLIWAANGVLLAYLLLAPRSRWPLYLCAGLAGHILGTAVIHAPWQVNLVDTPLDICEALLGAALLRRRSAQLPRFTQGAWLLRFFLFAALAAPLALALVFSLVQNFSFHASFPTSFFEWAATDSLGVCVVTPVCVAIFRARFRNFCLSGTDWALLLSIFAVALAILSQASIPLPFLLYPILILVLLRLGLGWAAMTTLFIAAAGSWFTVHGQGPFASFKSLSAFEPAVILQLFVAAATLMIYGVSVVVEDLRATERRLQEIAALHKLVTENSRDVITISDFDGTRSFVSAAATHWGGWTRAEMLKQRSLDLIHPADRPGMTETIQDLRVGKNSALAECRVRAKDGNYVWVEASLRTIRDPVTNLPTGVLSSIREITQRKCAEQQLAEAYRTVETLAITDALTGLPNRRHFDQCLASEWHRALREGTPLTLLLIDVDIFKSYNDTYGHLRGDFCLKQIADAALNVVARSGDLVARFGGEEFAVILPNTGINGAQRVAEDIGTVIRDRRLPHSANPSGNVTVSFGCATLIPQSDHNAAQLIENADKALYQAKRQGRNRVCKYRPTRAA